MKSCDASGLQCHGLRCREHGPVLAELGLRVDELGPVSAVELHGVELGYGRLDVDDRLAGSGEGDDP